MTRQRTSSTSYFSGVGRDDPVVHGRQEPAAGRVTAQDEAVSAVQAPDVRLARGGATAGRDEDLARAEAGHRSFERGQERFDRLIRRRSRHEASAYEGQRHEHVEQPGVIIGIDVVELALVEAARNSSPLMSIAA